MFLIVFTVIVNIQIKALDFAESFITSYDLTKRDTHEYNPYILTKTRSSFLQLEKSLVDAGFKLDGRYLIFGYQEEAVPPYTTDWERQAIKDEVIVETEAGISSPSRNLFGFITGFLLKDAQWMETHWNKSAVTQIMHVCAKPISLFNDESLVYQKHAFGADYDFIIRMRNRIENAVYTKNSILVLQELITFWSEMRERSSKTGSQEDVATQDIDFSLSYAQAIASGVTPINHIFIGPDITYPIEILSMQDAQATLHAQAFIETFEKKMVAINHEPTAYIFCSFVDGVGKSTLFNNLENYKKYGNNFNLYTRCDNSSSQIATISEFKKNVYMIDLPGQMSHFICKPDGYVFTDIQTVGQINAEQVARLNQYSTSRAEELTRNFKELVKQCAAKNAYLYEESDFIKIFAQNCANMAHVDLLWIPFVFENNIYIFNRTDQTKIRMLVPLENAHSAGLKIVEPEQMLFNKGLSLPMNYQVFLKDLLEKLHKTGIKNIRFVDFLSMYPRSSRETIRLNFVLQYLKKIFGERYALPHSFYSHKVYPAQETCGLLVDKFGQCVTHLVSETALRLAIDKIIQKNAQPYVTQLAGKKLEENLQVELKSIFASEHAKLVKLAQNRLEPERERYLQLYQYDRIYQSIVCFQPQLALLLVEAIIQLSAEHMQNEHMQNLWFNLYGNWLKISDRLSSGIAVKNFFSIHALCKDQAILSAFLKIIRSMCYAQTSNFLHAIPGEDGRYHLPIISCGVAPFKMVYGDDTYYLLQKKLPLLSTTIADVGFIWNGISSFDKHKHIPQLIKFNVFSKAGNGAWGLFDDVPYYLDWHVRNTSFGVYAYSYTNITKNVITKIVDVAIKNMSNEGKSNPYISTSQLLTMLQEEKAAQALAKEIEQKKAQEIPMNDPRIAGIRLALRIIATIELVCKDPAAKVMVRNGSKEDFIASIKLLESITLPYFFAIKLKHPLFEDYESVTPIIPIELQ